MFSASRAKKEKGKPYRSGYGEMTRVLGSGGGGRGMAKQDAHENKGRI